MVFMRTEGRICRNGIKGGYHEKKVKKILKRWAPSSVLCITKCTRKVSLHNALFT